MTDRPPPYSPTDLVTAGDGEDPPQFAPYDAACFVSTAGDVVSHDPHLNEDGEALYRFLLSQAADPPQLFLHCRGSHDETHTRLVPSRHGDRSDWRTEHYTEKVVDFDFKIDIGQHIVGNPTHWSVADSVPAYRGRMFHELGIGSEKRKAKRAELKAAKAWDKERDARGFPPWIGSDYAWSNDRPLMHNDGVLNSSWTLRQWADDYCSSTKFFKEFEYRKVVYGWDFDGLEAATRSVIVSTHYRGDIQVSFETLNSIISVRPHNRLSRALSNGWLKFLLIVTFIYPFLWLFRRFHPQGGGIWRVCGGAYALKRAEQTTTPQVCESKNVGISLPEVQSVDTRASGSTGSSDPQFSVVGLREGVWFRQWEGSIRAAVLNRVRESDPLAADAFGHGSVLF